MSGAANQKFCSVECYRKSLRKSFLKQRAIENATPRKPLEEWCREARECGLDYGNYRALINMGKTYEELKAQAEYRGGSAHSHRHPVKGGTQI